MKFTDENVYESAVEGANTWTPHSYPQGWQGLGNFDVINEEVSHAGSANDHFE